MTIQLFTLIGIFFIIGVPAVTLMAVHIEFGVTNQKTGLTTVSGKVMAVALAIIAAYIILVLTFGGKAVDHYFPLVKHSATVCEVKTTYERKGIN